MYGCGYVGVLACMSVGTWVYWRVWVWIRGCVGVCECGYVGVLACMGVGTWVCWRVWVWVRGCVGVYGCGCVIIIIYLIVDKSR